MAVTVKVCTPFETVPEFHEFVNGGVPVLITEIPSTLKLTDITPTLSEAFTKTSIVPETDAPLAGEVMLIVGGIISRFPPLSAEDLPERSSLVAKYSEDIINGTLLIARGSSGITPDSFCSEKFSGRSFELSCDSSFWQDVHITVPTSNAASPLLTCKFFIGLIWIK
jgi:hypothetical protein